MDELDNDERPSTAEISAAEVLAEVERRRTVRHAMMDGPAKDEQPTAEASVAEVLAEVERRRAARRAMRERPSQAVTLANRLVLRLSKHWLAVFNALAFLYVGLPFLAPILMHLGANRPAMIVYSIYRPLCHQLPQRSFFLFGPQWTYTLAELVEWLGTSTGIDLPTRAFVGNEAIGYKVALCQRDTAIYGTILLAGLLYGLLRRRWKIAPLPWWAYAGLGLVPMLLDGGYQFLSYVLSAFWPGSPITPHETTPAMRVITGALFGLATVWLAYPHVQEAMEEMREAPPKQIERE